MLSISMALAVLLVRAVSRATAVAEVSGLCDNYRKNNEKTISNGEFTISVELDSNTIKDVSCKHL